MSHMKAQSKSTSTIQTITKEELLNKIKEREQIQIVNVLATEHYHLGSIIDSTKIPLDELDNRLNELNKNDEIIVYCASSECPASRKAAEKLAANGFNVKAYEGGIKEWKEAALPTEE